MWLVSFVHAYRKERNMFVFGLCYAAAGISVLGSLFVFLNALEKLDVRRGTFLDSAAMYAHTVGFISVAALVLRSELK